MTIPVEYFDELNQLSAELGPIGYIYVLLDYKGAFDPDRLGTALRRLIDAQPVLACRFDDNGGKPVWRRRDDLDQIAACHLIVSTNVEADTAAWLSDRFDWRTSGNVGAALLRAADGTGDRLLLRFSHVAGDGAATLNAVAELTGLYSRLATEPEYRPTINTASRDGFRWLKDFSRMDRLRLWLRDLGNLPRALKRHRGLVFEDAKTFLADLAAVIPAYRILRLGEDRVVAIDQYARAREATVNDVLLAAFVRAFDEFCPSRANTDLIVGLPPICGAALRCSNDRPSRTSRVVSWPAYAPRPANRSKARWPAYGRKYSGTAAAISAPRAKSSTGCWRAPRLPGSAGLPKNPVG
jgi:NRPS condensation-like uncharacterized protein